ncbi:metal ABC transporter permease [Clostridium sp.]|uniref:metal ABC transporter permease n=1 Tax=Clostridium sp. TaxID=1506 RepID=UPI0028441045|nr:metal ABC transporter permease [Clostridium sp.]MDR3597668.1 metal ABC transporter permease [Clostridium sp.]
MKEFLTFLFAPGFFESTQVLRALILGSIVAAISGVIGVFVIIKGQTFAAHAIADFGGAGAAIIFLSGINSLWGFFGFGVLAAIGVELLGTKAKEKDLSTGVVLSIALGVQALFLYFDTHLTQKSSEPMLILFGSIFVVNPTTIYVVAFLTIATILVFSIFYRPILLCSIDSDLAKTRGVNITLIGVIFIILLAFVVEEGSLIMGSLLSSALLIGPAAAAMRLTHKMNFAMLLSAVIGILSVCLGVVLAYDSFYWPPYGRGWPVSFFISVLVLVFYVLSRIKEKFVSFPEIKKGGMISNE